MPLGFKMYTISFCRSFATLGYIFHEISLYVLNIIKFLVTFFSISLAVFSDEETLLSIPRATVNKAMQKVDYMQ